MCLWSGRTMNHLSTVYINNLRIVEGFCMLCSQQTHLLAWINLPDYLWLIQVICTLASFAIKGAWLISMTLMSSVNGVIMSTIHQVNSRNFCSVLVVFGFLTSSVASRSSVLLKFLHLREWGHSCASGHSAARWKCASRPCIDPAWNVLSWNTALGTPPNAVIGWDGNDE